jgi:hypothetical protein
MALSVVQLAALVWQQRQTRSPSPSNARAYFALIDPPAPGLLSSRIPTFPVAMLDGCGQNFDLSREQFVELVSIHQSYDARLDACTCSSSI